MGRWASSAESSSPGRSPGGECVILWPAMAHRIPFAAGAAALFPFGALVLAFSAFWIVVEAAGAPDTRHYGRRADPGGCHWEIVGPAGIVGRSGWSDGSTALEPGGMPILLLDQCRGLAWHLEPVPSGFEWVRARFRDDYSVILEDSPAPGPRP